MSTLIRGIWPGEGSANGRYWCQSNSYSPTMTKKRDGTPFGSPRLWYSLALVGLLIATGSALLVGLTNLPAPVGTFFVTLGLLVLVGAAGIGVTKSRRR
jgi:hypothetical protein